MRLGKRVADSDWVKSVLCWTIATYARTAYASVRWQVRGQELSDSLFADRKPYIVAFWHGRTLYAPFIIPRHLRRYTPVKAIMSRHRDGEWVARTVHHMGIEAIRGSSTRGGVLALRQALRALKGGFVVGVALDGPRGPRMRMQPGAISLAKHTDAPILPVTWSVSRRRVLKTWDRFVVPLPFGRGAFLWGEPIYVPRDADDAAQEAARRRVELELIRLTEEADQMVGVEPIAPEPLADELDHDSTSPALASATAR